jgi:hypothetical protein
MTCGVPHSSKNRSIIQFVTNFLEIFSDFLRRSAIRAARARGRLRIIKPDQLFIVAST